MCNSFFTHFFLLDNFELQMSIAQLALPVYFYIVHGMEQLKQLSQELLTSDVPFRSDLCFICQESVAYTVTLSENRKSQIINALTVMYDQILKESICWKRDQIYTMRLTLVARRIQQKAHYISTRRSLSLKIMQIFLGTDSVVLPLKENPISQNVL